jgi:hypothetical protein
LPEGGRLSAEGTAGFTSSGEEAPAAGLASCETALLMTFWAGNPVILAIRFPLKTSTLIGRHACLRSYT